MSMNIYKRRQSIPVFVGQVGVGGNYPIRVQSMLTSDTKNTDNCITEIQKLIDAGCEIIRLTVPTKADCQNLAHIRARMKELGLKAPLVADIHFTPSIAMDVVNFVEKVRINPGNFVDKKLFKSHEYTDEEYQSELERIREKFIPLVEKCKEHGVAMRIGTNHGSLSDRILNRYGDTAEGMAESALEFLRIAHSLNYTDIILSMKASNTQVMVTAYRLIVQKLEQENLPAYPLHLGVTEAGEGEDGRTKSAVGIGTLLEEGLGDTVRVSLTEDSYYEIPVATALVSPYNSRMANQRLAHDDHRQPEVPCPAHLKFLQESRFKDSYQKRNSNSVLIGSQEHGGKEVPKIWTTLKTEADFESFLKAQNADFKFEGVEIDHSLYWDEFAEQIQAQNFALSVKSNKAQDLLNCDKADLLCLEISALNDLKQIKTLTEQNKPVQIVLRNGLIWNAELTQALTDLNTPQNTIWSVVNADSSNAYRVLAKILTDLNKDDPIHLRYENSDMAEPLGASTQMGSVLLDGIGDSIQLTINDTYKNQMMLTYGILQACRVRISKTEFIACPSCGRTLFDLQEVTARIKAKTNHLKGVKIAIMGCIVNGPGEMADADFGYVGTGTGKISLYVGKEVVQRNIPEAQALDSLIELIKEHKMWVDPSEQAA